jgi:hypothetical protein
MSAYNFRFYVPHGTPPMCRETSSVEMGQKLKHLRSALVRPIVIPCCTKLMLVICGEGETSQVPSVPFQTRELFNEWREQYNMYGFRRLSGDVQIRLNDQSPAPGDNYFVACHDVQADGPFQAYPRGAQLTGGEISYSFVQFTPSVECLVRSADDGVSVSEASDRMYTLHLDGQVDGTYVSQTQFLAFSHPQDPLQIDKREKHAACGALAEDLEWSFCSRNYPEYHTLEINEVPHPDCKRTRIFHDDLCPSVFARHNTITGMILRSGTPNAWTVRSRRAYVRDLEIRTARILPLD